MLSTFGIGRERALRDTDLADVRHVVGQARLAGRTLSTLVDDWRESAGLRVASAVSTTDRRVQEVILRSEQPIPHREWGTAAGQLVHAARSALDHLNAVMMTQFATAPFDDHRIYFPITESGKDWRSWRQRHRQLPDWVVTRYGAVQPSAGPFHGLAGLARLDDASKHRHIVPVQLAVLGALGEGNYVLNGIPSGEGPVIALEAVSNILTPSVKQVTVARVQYGFDILKADSSSVEVTDIEPLFVFGKDSYSLLELLNLPERVDAAIDYIATGSIGALERYQARFVDPRVIGN